MTATRPPTPATLKDVARRAGVSVAAASQALNDRGALRPETRRHILACAQELGYVPHRFATALRRGRTMSLGYAASAATDVEGRARRALSSMLQLGELVAVAARYGYTVTVIPDDRPDLLHGARVDAVYLPDARASDPLVVAARGARIPIVTNDLALPADEGVWVRTGYAEAAGAALDLLERSGAATVGLLIDAPGSVRTGIGEQVYRDWVRASGRRELVAAVDAERTDLPGRVRELLAAGADAVFSFAQDGPAVFVELERAGVVPRDLQLVTLCLYDCTANGRLGISRACVHPDLAPGLVLPELDAWLTAGRTPRSPVTLPWELVHGSTTRA